MIRRRVGDEFWLITQDDHARISGKLAQAIGHAPYSPPTSASAILGIAMHDSGWPLHDDLPTLNNENLPLDVFESPREIALSVWELSAEKAAQRDDYAGLLVSLHGLGLSVYVAEQTKLDDPRARFEMNRFQHKMIELQESLRQRLGMKTDRPLKHGLAVDSHDPREQKLLFDFRWLAAMDRLSLSICCAKPPFDLMEIIPRIGESASSIKIQRDANDVLLDPWPPQNAPIEIHVPYRRIPAKQYADITEFRAAYAAAAVEQFTAAVRGRNI
jgi:Protein of unknown function (DUF3891)